MTNLQEELQSNYIQTLSEKARLLGAVRFPNDTFKAIAGTQVTTDLLFLQKKDSATNDSPDWVERAYLQDVGNINKYFINNPQMVLGEQKAIKGQFGWSMECLPTDGSLYNKLNHALTTITANFSATPTVDTVQKTDIEKHNEGLNKASENIEDYTYSIHNESLFYCENRLLYPIERTAADIQRIKGMLGVLDSLKACLNTQMAGLGIDERENARLELNNKYYGLNLSLDRLQKVDIEFIAAICNKQPNEVISELGDKIYLSKDY